MQSLDLAFFYPFAHIMLALHIAFSLLVLSVITHIQLTIKHTIYDRSCMQSLSIRISVLIHVNRLTLQKQIHDGD